MAGRLDLKGRSDSDEDLGISRGNKATLRCEVRGSQLLRGGIGGADDSM